MGHERLAYRVWAAFVMVLVVGVVFLLSGGVGIVHNLWRMTFGM